MANGNRAKIIYLILKEIEESRREGRKVNKDEISAERFNIHESYLLDILEELVKNGYIDCFQIRQTKGGRITTDIADARITESGCEYLEENSTMKKIEKLAKEACDLFPLIK